MGTGNLSALMERSGEGWGAPEPVASAPPPFWPMWTGLARRAGHLDLLVAVELGWVAYPPGLPVHSYFDTSNKS